MQFVRLSLVHVVPSKLYDVTRERVVELREDVILPDIHGVFLWVEWVLLCPVMRIGLRLQDLGDSIAFVAVGARLRL